MTDKELYAMGQGFFAWLRPQLSGWEPALISTDRKIYARIQLQSEPPESEECGRIHCITKTTLTECVEACIHWCKDNKIERPR